MTTLTFNRRSSLVCAAGDQLANVLLPHANRGSVRAFGESHRRIVLQIAMAGQTSLKTNLRLIPGYRGDVDEYAGKCLAGQHPEDDVPYGLPFGHETRNRSQWLETPRVVLERRGRGSPGRAGRGHHCIPICDTEMQVPIVFLAAGTGDLADRGRRGIRVGPTRSLDGG